MFSHIADVVSLRIQDHITIGLLEAEKDIHHLDLPLDHNAGLLEQCCGRMIRLEDSSRVFGDVNRCEQAVVRGLCLSKQI